MIATIGRWFTGTVAELLDLFALVFISLKSSLSVVRSSRRAMFWRLFKRQIYFAGVRTLYVTGVISLLLGALLVDKLGGLAQGQTFTEAYAQLYVILIVRELAPLICGIILIGRSASAITAEIGYLKISNEFEVLRGLGIDPVFVFLVPVFFAFPLALMLMLIYFDFMSILAGYAMIWLFEPTRGFYEFLTTVLGKLTFLEMFITMLKGIVGGFFIGVVSIYFGSKVGSKFTDISRAISDATTSQLVIFFVINIMLSILAYGS